LKDLIVCHITTVHPVNDNRIFFKQCSSLKQFGYKVFFICAGANSTIRNGIDIIGIPKYSNRLVHFVKVSVVDVIRVALRVDAKIYQIHDPELIIAGLILRLCKKKVIYDIHEDNSSSLLTKPYFRSKILAKVVSKLVDNFEKSASQFFTKIITARPDISIKFKKRNPLTINNFPILNPQLQNKSISKKNHSVVIFVGGLSKIRGIPQLIESFQYLQDTELWLLGPWQDNAFQEACSKLSGWNKTKYLGIVKPHEIFEYVVQADIGIITFLPVPNHIKTLATKPFEYMMAGLPVIMSNFEYWQSFFGDVAIYTDPNDSKAISYSIRKLLSNPNQMKSLGKKGQRLVKNKLNWEEESIKLIRLYNSLDD